MIGRALAALGRFLASGGRTVDPAARLAVCDACSYRRAPGRCGLCGCFVDAKARMATETCPAGRWPA